jgi:hypothetical protein
MGRPLPRSATTQRQDRPGAGCGATSARICGPAQKASHFGKIAFCCHQAEAGVSASLPLMSHCFWLPGEYVIGTGGRLLARTPRRAVKRQHAMFTLASVNPAALEVRSG